MPSSPLGTVLLAFAIIFAFTGVLYSNLSWVIATIGLFTAFVYAHLRFSREIRATDLEIERTVLEDIVHTEEPVSIRTTVLNRGNATVRGTFEDLIPDGCTISGGENRVATVIRPGYLLVMRYSITPKKRGHHSIEGMKVTKEDALGLYIEDEVILHETTFSAQMQRESFDAARRLAGREHVEFSGLARSPAVVLRELEFERIREYVPGDRARDIHWKALSKMNKLMTKTYRKEGVLQTTIFVDAGRSMRLETPPLTKIDHALDITVQLSNVLLSSLHPAGVAIFDEMKVLDKANPATGKHQLERITRVLRSIPESYGSKGASAASVGKAAPSIRPSAGNSGARPGNEANRFLSTVESLSKPRRRRGLGLGLDGAINELISTSRGKEQLFIVITDLISSREAVISGARICRRTGNKMLVIHTYHDWYRRTVGADGPEEIERLYEDLSGSLKVEGLLRALGATYIRVGPADSASNIVRAVRRGKA